MSVKSMLAMQAVLRVKLINISLGRHYNVLNMYSHSYVRLDTAIDPSTPRFAYTLITSSFLTLRFLGW